MLELDEADLETIGRKAAQTVPDLGEVAQIKVTPRLDSLDRPAYVFSYVVDRRRDAASPGLARIRLIQSLRKELLDREDEHTPIVEVMSRADWEARERA